MTQYMELLGHPADVLPSDKITEHWYNDLQHVMFVILFRRADRALAEERSAGLAYLMDMTTLYLYVHFLHEEEGMAYSLVHGGHDRERVRRHTSTHLDFLAL